MALPIIPAVPRTEDEREILRWRNEVRDWLVTVNNLFPIENDESVLGSDYTITADSTWEDTGLQITLGTAGVYLILGDVRGISELSVAGIGRLVTRLYDNTNSAAIANSERTIIEGQIVDEQFESTTPLTQIITTTTDDIVLNVQGFRTNGTWTISDVKSDGQGRTKISYVRLSD